MADELEDTAEIEPEEDELPAESMDLDDEEEDDEEIEPEPEYDDEGNLIEPEEPETTEETPAAAAAAAPTTPAEPIAFNLPAPPEVFKRGTMEYAVSEGGDSLHEAMFEDPTSDEAQELIQHLTDTYGEAAANLHYQNLSREYNKAKDSYADQRTFAIEQSLTQGAAAYQQSIERVNEKVRVEMLEGLPADDILSHFAPLAGRLLNEQRGTAIQSLMENRGMTLRAAQVRVDAHLLAQPDLYETALAHAAVKDLPTFVKMIKGAVYRELGMEVPGGKKATTSSPPALQADGSPAPPAQPSNGRSKPPAGVGASGAPTRTAPANNDPAKMVLSAEDRAYAIKSGIPKDNKVLQAKFIMAIKGMQ